MSPSGDIYSKTIPNKLQNMSAWTTRHSVLLSHILDGIIGTQEEVEIRKDYCQLRDCVESATSGYNQYFTGSKAEGLNLPGSDKDFMRDIDEMYEIQVIEQGQAVPQSRRRNLFVMVTDNVHPAFAMLRIIPPAMIDMAVLDSLQTVDGSDFLSSYLMLLNLKPIVCQCNHEKIRIQGPSLEHSFESIGGIDDQDYVYCIHCSFWPNVASEWVHRTRFHNWPEIK